MCLPSSGKAYCIAALESTGETQGARRGRGRCGPNGLAAAITLARAGRSVRVLVGRDADAYWALMTLVRSWPISGLGLCQCRVARSRWPDSGWWPSGRRQGAGATGGGWRRTPCSRSIESRVPRSLSFSTFSAMPAAGRSYAPGLNGSRTPSRCLEALGGTLVTGHVVGTGSLPFTGLSDNFAGQRSM